MVLLPFPSSDPQFIHCTAELKRQGGKGLLVPVCEFTSEKADGGDFTKEAFAEGAMTFASLHSLQCKVWKAIKEKELL